MFDFERFPVGVRRLHSATESMDGAQVQVRARGDIALVVVSGEINLSNKACVSAAINASIEGYNAVILSLESCDYLTKRAASLFADIRGRLGLGFVIVSCGPTRRLLADAKIDEAIPVTSTVADALELLEAAGYGAD